MLCRWVECAVESEGRSKPLAKARFRHLPGLRRLVAPEEQVFKSLAIGASLPQGFEREHVCAVRGTGGLTETITF